MSEKIDCTVIGDAMIDITLPLDDAKSLEYIHGGVINTSFKISPGGTANVAVNLSDLGLKAAFIGRIGNDPFGKMFTEDLLQHKVLCNVTISDTEKTGIAISMVFQNRERSFFVNRGANAGLLYEHIDSRLIWNSRTAYFSGFSLQDKDASQTVHRAIKEAREKGVEVIFNPGAPNLAKKYREAFLGVIQNYVDTLVLNDAEGKFLAGYDNETDIIRFLLSLGPKRIALTKGCNGSILATRSEVNHIKAFKTECMDPSGAGDSYSAGLIYGLLNGWREDKAATFASEIASKAVSHWGARLDDGQTESK